MLGILLVQRDADIIHKLYSFNALRKPVLLGVLSFSHRQGRLDGLFMILIREHMLLHWYGGFLRRFAQGC